MPINYARTAGDMADLVSQPVNSFLNAKYAAEQNTRRNALTDQVAQRTNIEWQQQQQDRAAAQQAGQQKQEAEQRRQQVLQTDAFMSAAQQDPKVMHDALIKLEQSGRLPPDLQGWQQRPTQDLLGDIQRKQAILRAENADLFPQEKPQDPTTDLRNFEAAQANPAFAQFLDRNRKAAAGGGGVAADGGYSVLTPEEAAAIGLPPGTVAQRNAKGKIDVISTKPQQQLTPKDASAARSKLNAIRVARTQLALVKQKFDALKGSVSAGAFGQGKLPTPSGKAFDAAVNSMRDTITTLTRTPGIGAQSDFETRLTQAKLPDRGQYEDVTAQQIQSLQDLFDGLDSGYREMLTTGPADSAQAPPAAQPSAAGHPADVQSILDKYGKK